MKLLLKFSALFGLLLTVAGCGSGEGSKPENKVRLASVEALEPIAATGYPVEERFVGMVEARRRSDLAFELAGTVSEVTVNEGDAVAAGEILARLDTSRLQARKEELSAALMQAVASRDLATKMLDRIGQLVEGGGVSVQDLDEAVERVAASGAGVSQIEAQLKSVEVDLGKSVLRAPYDGAVARRHVDEGSVVSPNEVVFGWIESGVLEIRVGMATEAVSQLQSGHHIEVKSDSGKVISLEILRILPQRDRQARTVDIILAAPPDLPLRDGDLVSALHTQQVETPGFFLPRDALTESVRGLWACYVALPDPETGPEAYRLDRRDLEILHEYADEVFVRGAIREREKVIANGIQKIVPGQRVKMLDVRPFTISGRNITGME